MEKIEAIEKSLCRELDAIEHKLEGGQEMSIQDLEKIDKIAHAMKCLATYKAMKEAEEYDQREYDGYSGRRGRAANGQYISRDMSPRGYSDMPYRDYPPAPRW